MGALNLESKKALERHYLEEARRVSPIFPAGLIEPNKWPDFVLHAKNRIIGIEITELCREKPRAEGGRLAKIPAKAKENYYRLTNAQAVDVSITFWQAENVSFNILTASLAEFVYLHKNGKGTSFMSGLPEGFGHVGIHEPRSPEGHWHALRYHDTVLTPKDLIDSRIAKKNQRLPDYRRSTPEVWLLIVNDQSLGPGEPYTRPEDLDAWKFTFSFEKVLLFSRQAGGSGDVLEVRRA